MTCTLALVAAVLLAQAEPGSVEARSKIRPLVGVGAAGKLNNVAFFIAGGPGVTTEVGFVVGDQLAASLRVSLGIIPPGLAASVGVGVEYILSDYVRLGGGVALELAGNLVADSWLALMVTLPLRATFTPMARLSNRTAHSGLAFFVEAGPGVGVGPGSVSWSRLAILTAMVGVGYALW